MSKKFMPCAAAFIVFLYGLPAYGQGELPEGRGKTAVQRYCAPCHGRGEIARAAHNESGWRDAISMPCGITYSAVSRPFDPSSP